MAVPSTAEAMGQAFSALSVSHEDRLMFINSIREAANNLYIAISNEQIAETLATGNSVISDFDAFRGNGVGTNPDGINNDVQAKGESLFTALNMLA